MNNWFAWWNAPHTNTFIVTDRRNYKLIRNDVTFQLNLFVVFDRIGGTGSIPDLGAGSAGHHYMTSTPNPKSPAFGAGVSGQDRDLCGNDPPVNFTRSLPRSAKDFSTLMYRNVPKPSNLASIASIYQDDVDDVLDEDDDVDQRRNQMKILQGLAREMNWSLPVATTNFDTYSPSRFNRYLTINIISCSPIAGFNS